MRRGVGLGTVSFFPRTGYCPPGFRDGQGGKAMHYHTLRWGLDRRGVASRKKSIHHLQEGPVLRSQAGAAVSPGVGESILMVEYARSLEGKCVGRSIV
jgi:hypothetical protein